MKLNPCSAEDFLALKRYSHNDIQLSYIHWLIHGPESTTNFVKCKASGSRCLTILKPSFSIWWGRAKKQISVKMSICQMVQICAIRRLRVNPLTTVVRMPEVTWSLHKLMGIYMGDLILGDILQYMVSAFFSSQKRYSWMTSLMSPIVLPFSGIVTITNYRMPRM